jgi:hypothetical protein
MYLDLPEGYTGRMRLRVKDSDELIEFDEFDRRHPDKHDEIAELLIASVGKCLHTPVYVNIENN